MRAPRLRFAILLVALLYPVAEFTLLSLLAQAIGWTPVLLLLCACAVAGIVIMRASGARAMSALAAGARMGRLPGGEAGDHGLRALGGLLLALPGLMSDIAAAALFVPRVRRVLLRRLGRLAPAPSGPAAYDVVIGEVIHDDPAPPEPPAAGPSG